MALLDRAGGRTAVTADGQAFLPHARAVVAAADAALAAVAPAGPLRVDVIASRSGTADLLIALARRHPGVDVEMVMLPRRADAADAVLAGTVDAAFCCVLDPDAVPAGSSTPARTTSRSNSSSGRDTRSPRSTRCGRPSCRRCGCPG